MKGELKLSSTRQFRQSDVNDVIKINRICLPENYSRFFFLKEASRTPRAFRVYEENQTICAYVIGRVERLTEELTNLLRPGSFIENKTAFGQFQKYLQAFQDDKKVGHIVSIAVLHKYRRRGIGFHLLSASIDAMKLQDIVLVYLEVRKSNTEAIALYKKYGFQIAGTLTDYYISQREDACLMILPLDPRINSTFSKDSNS
ncbi:MAG: GNAT family N-acetyltransferase [Candidatus Hermodarchaeota archaeon]